MASLAAAATAAAAQQQQKQPQQGKQPQKSTSKPVTAASDDGMSQATKAAPSNPTAATTTTPVAADGAKKKAAPPTVDTSKHSASVTFGAGGASAMAKSVKMFTKMMQTTTSAHRWLQDSKVVKSYVKILGKPPASRTVRDVQRLCVFFQESQRSFCESLSKDKVERDACLMRICKAVRLISVDPGTVIIKQGDEGKEFYIVFSGHCDIYYKSDSDVVDRVAGRYTHEKVGAEVDPITFSSQLIGGLSAAQPLGKFVKKLYPGDGFGDVALRHPGALRTASVVCSGIPQSAGMPALPGELMVITGEVYQQSIAMNRQEGNVLQRKLAHLKAMWIFRGWSLSDLTFFAYSLVERRLQDSEYLFKAGQDVEDVFFVASGRVNLIAPPNVVRETIREGRWSHGVEHKYPAVEVEIVPTLGLVGELDLLERVLKHSLSAVAVGSGTTVYACNAYTFSSFLQSANNRKGDKKKSPHKAASAVAKATAARLLMLAQARRDWHSDRVSVSRSSSEMAMYKTPLTLSMQIGVLPCARCGGMDHATTSKFCPLHRAVKPTQAGVALFVGATRHAKHSKRKALVASKLFGGLKPMAHQPEIVYKAVKPGGPRIAKPGRAQVTGVAKGMSYSALAVDTSAPAPPTGSSKVSARRPPAVTPIAAALAGRKAGLKAHRPPASSSRTPRPTPRSTRSTGSNLSRLSMTSGAGAASVSGKSTRKGHGGGGSASSVTAPTPSGTSTLKAKDTRKAAAAMARRDRARKAKLEAMASNLDALFKGSDIVVTSPSMSVTSTNIWAPPPPRESPTWMRAPKQRPTAAPSTNTIRKLRLARSIIVDSKSSGKRRPSSAPSGEGGPADHEGGDARPPDEHGQLPALAPVSVTHVGMSPTPAILTPLSGVVSPLNDEDVEGGRRAGGSAATLSNTDELEMFLAALPLQPRVATSRSAAIPEEEDEEQMQFG